MTLAERCMERTIAYRLWQAPFAEHKFRPIREHNDLATVRRVLDVGCGPGTNAHWFADADYTGIDMNSRYIEAARRRHHGRFLVADATTYRPEEGAYDFILLNSFLHHMATPHARRILANLGTILTEGGHVHVLDLVLPETRSVARALAHHDRGAHPRPIARWRELFQESLEPVLFEPYALRGFGATLWNMVYFKGSARG